MIYGYLRVSTDKQDLENQKYELTNFSNKKELPIEKWIEEKISSTEVLTKRKFGKLMKKFKKGDILFVSELSRIGRNLLQVMSILNFCMENDIMVYTAKEKYELGNNINSKVLAFAFGLSAEIERNLISQRTKEALARRKASGALTGRPMGVKSSKTKLTGKKTEIKELYAKKVPISAIARIIGVNRQTISKALVEWGIHTVDSEKGRAGAVRLSKYNIELTEDEVITLFEKARYSINNMAKDMKVPSDVLRNYCKKMGYMDLMFEIHKEQRAKYPDRNGNVYTYANINI